MTCFLTNRAFQGTGWRSWRWNNVSDSIGSWALESKWHTFSLKLQMLLKNEGNAWVYFPAQLHFLAIVHILGVSIWKCKSQISNESSNELVSFKLINILNANNVSSSCFQDKRILNLELMCYPGLQIMKLAILVKHNDWYEMFFNDMMIQIVLIFRKQNCLFLENFTLRQSFQAGEKQPKLQEMLWKKQQWIMGKILFDFLFCWLTFLNVPV